MLKFKYLKKTSSIKPIDNSIAAKPKIKNVSDTNEISSIIDPIKLLYTYKQTQVVSERIIKKKKL